VKNIACVLMALLLCITCIKGIAVETSAQSAIVIEAENGSVLWEKNAYDRLTMASTTKIMTAICAIEDGDLDKKVKISPQAVGVEGSSIYLKNDEVLTLRELVYGLMLNSGNDAAVAIACAVSGSVGKFSTLMNQKAEEIGVKDSHFQNPNGLDEEGHYTTAYDLGKITAYALKNDEFRKIVSTYQTTISALEGKRYLTNHNKLLKRMEGCIGVKTGFTKKSGRCLVSAAERNGVTLVAVTLNAPDDWNDHIKMMDYGYTKVKLKEVTYKGEHLADVSIKKGTSHKVGIVCPEEYKVPTVDSSRYVSIFKTPEYVTAPIKKGEVLGKIEVYMDGRLIKTLPAVAKNNVNEDLSRSLKKSFTELMLTFLGREPRSDK